MRKSSLGPLAQLSYKKTIKKKTPMKPFTINLQSYYKLKQECTGWNIWPALLTMIDFFLLKLLKVKYYTSLTINELCQWGQGRDMFTWQSFHTPNIVDLCLKYLEKKSKLQNSTMTNGAWKWGQWQMITAKKSFTLNYHSVH